MSSICSIEKISSSLSREISFTNFNISSLDKLDIFLSILLNFVNIYKIYLPSIEFCPIRAT